VTKLDKNMAQLSASQRYEIGTLKGLGMGPTQIMKHTGIHKSVVSRELDRNSKGGVYDAARAQKLCAARRRRGLRKIKGALKEEVEGMLGQQYSPEQIQGRLVLEGRPGVSHESIYQHVYRDKTQGGELYKNLRFGHKKRRKRLAAKDRRGVIPNKRMIDERPKEVEEKSRLGDWEGDTIIGKGHQGAAVTLVERLSKTTLIQQVEGKTAKEVGEAVIRMLKNSPIPVLSLTFDNGTEFADHLNIAQQIAAPVFFAHPYRSCERGLNENTNGLIRQYIPKSQNFKELSPQDFQTVQDKLNNRPRKSLGFLSPIEFLYSSSQSPPGCCI
jgi:transposase, IS30 family